MLATLRSRSPPNEPRTRAEIMYKLSETFEGRDDCARENPRCRISQRTRGKKAESSRPRTRSRHKVESRRTPFRGQKANERDVPGQLRGRQRRNVIGRSHRVAIERSSGVTPRFANGALRVRARECGRKIFIAPIIDKWLSAPGAVHSFRILAGGLPRRSNKQSIIEIFPRTTRCITHEHVRNFETSDIKRVN